MGNWVRVVAIATLVMTAPIAGPVAAQPSSAPGDYDGSFLKRITLLVADLDRSLRIYRDILGFEAGPVSEFQPTSYSYTVFNIDKAARIKGSMLSAGPDQIRTLALFQIDGQKITVPQGPRPVAAVIRARNLAKIKEEIGRLGLETFPPRALRTPEGATGEEWAFVDPDGHLVVLYELSAPEAAPKR